MRRPVRGGVCAPADFVAGAIACGVKDANSERPDVALIVSRRPCSAAATFTTNAVKAAPVRVSKLHLRSGNARAVILNSGNANACTGHQGLRDAVRMAEAAASRTDLLPKQVLVGSTGRIGVPLPVDRIVRGVSRIPLTRTGGRACAKAIMTSDTFAKQLSFSVKGRKGTFSIGGIAKGAGMINPNMATMLCVVTTDAVVAPAALRRALRESVEVSFNRITVDGDMSTNDCVIALANGASGTRPLAKDFREALDAVTQGLARMIVKDGEGVSRFVEIALRGAASAADAVRAARAVANSTLVKCAWAGGDSNWGRIMDALGYSGAKLREDKIDVYYNDLPVALGGVAAPTAPRKVRAVARRREFTVQINLGVGTFSHTMWTTDLTEEYVRFNLGE